MTLSQLKYFMKLRNSEYTFRNETQFFFDLERAGFKASELGITNSDKAGNLYWETPHGRLMQKGSWGKLELQTEEKV